ncbi:DUF962 domain-containing protein [Legionella brunensis]|uniref:Transmembrane protein n=1 Tax=Legionella brunensis TaxID=29422 RepID=A0A0W0SND1_9GAMM|nr:Mpo1-like protein [Legionella brunensis]KTC84919.1 transmembrane protein [Legionella brunensis]
MKSFIEQAQFYAEYHQKPITFYTHLIGVPLIIFSLMLFLGFFHLIVPGVLDTNFASIGTVIVLIYYFLLNWRLALILTPIFICLLWIANLISWAGPTSGALWTFVIIFILGWILQLAGHYIEGKRPALVDNFWQALVAPLYLTAELFFRAGRMKNLKTQIHGGEIPPAQPVTTEKASSAADDIM